MMTKQINGYEGLYEINRNGDVFSINYRRTGRRKRLKHSINDSGYCVVRLYKNGESVCKRVHRLIAESFIPNPKCKKTINHKDGNPLNNNISNLEWATQAENNLHAYRVLGRKVSMGNLGKFGIDAPRKRSVLKCNEVDDVIERFVTIKQASEITKVNSGSIGMCCRNLRIRAGGYRWRYADGA